MWLDVDSCLNLFFRSGSICKVLLAGPLKTFLSKLLQIDLAHIFISSISRARRLAKLRRLLAESLAVDYSVEVEAENVSSVVTLMNSADPTETTTLLQENLPEMNISIEVLEVQVLQTSLDNDERTVPGDWTWLGILIGGIFGACLCGSVAFACLKLKKSSNSNMLPKNLPTIHGQKNVQGLQKSASNVTMASQKSGPYVVSRL